MIVGFEESAFLVKEPVGEVRLAIVRRGDLSQPISLVCFTRQLTAIEDKDYVARHSLELSRIHFGPGEKVKLRPISCSFQIISYLFI